MLAVNLAVELARRAPEQVVLVDLSLTFGHDLLLLNLTSKSSLSGTSAEALRKADLEHGLAHYLVIHPSSSLRVLAGSTKPEEGEMVTGEMVTAAIEQLARHFKYVVVDTGSQFTDPVLAALESADAVLMVCSPEIPTLRDVKDCQKILNDVVHVKRDKIHYVMNQIFPFKALSTEQFEEALQLYMFADLPYGGDVGAKSALRGEAFVETQSGSNLAKSIRKLAEQLVATDPKTGALIVAQKDHKRGFFR